MSTLTAPLVAKTREWTSFHGSPVPLRSDAVSVGEDFVRALHHRLCQPLTALSCTLELMQIGREEDARLIEQLRAAVEQSDRIMGMMAMFRQLFEAGAPAVVQASSLQGVLEDVVEDLHPVAEHRGVRLASEVQGTCSVAMESTRLRQALWNVLQNCIELTSADCAVELYLEDKSLVIEHECCISTAEFENLFDPFSFCQNSRCSTAKVSNLPVAVAKKMMEADGGAMSAQRNAPFRRLILTFQPASA